MLGGKTDDVHKEVLVCDFTPDGAPVNWRQTMALPFPLWFHGTALLQNRVFVWGGLTTNSNKDTSGKVLSARVTAEGGLEEWREEEPLVSGVFGGGFCGFNDNLLCVAGRYQNGYTNIVIWFSRIVSGNSGAWTPINTNVEARLHHSVGLDRDRGWVFVTGGENRAGIGTEEARTMIDVVQAFNVGGPPETKATTGGGGVAVASGAGGGSGVSVFVPLSQVLAADGVGLKPILVFFHSPAVPDAVRFRTEVLEKSEFARLAAAYTLATVDSSGSDSSFSYRYGIFQVPSLAVLSPQGEIRGKKLRPETLEHVTELLNSAR